MDFLKFLVESQTVAQNLKSRKDYAPEEVKEVKTKVRASLLKEPFVKANLKHLESYVNFFTNQILNKNLFFIKNLYNRKAALTIDSDHVKGGNLNYMLNNTKDYLAANKTSNTFLSKLNNSEYDFDQLKKDSEIWHQEMEVHGSEAGAKGKTILSLDKIGWPGWKWVSLGKGYCPQEARSMGHCGNADAREGDDIVSLRDPENKAHLTFIINNGALGESKGRSNAKPSAKYHAPIAELLRTKHIKTVVGGGYKPENNFHLKDLRPDTKDELVKNKPGLASYFDHIIGKKTGVKLLNAVNAISPEKFQSINKNTLVLNSFDSFSELQKYLKDTNSDIDDFAWIENNDFDISYTPRESDIKDSFSYINKENEQLLIQNLKNPPDGYEGNWDSLDLEEKVLEDDEIKDAMILAIDDGNRIGTENEAYKDVIEQLGRPDDNGFYVSFNKGIHLSIDVSGLKALFDENGNRVADEYDLSSFIKLNYKTPYNGYSDWSSDAFNERLKETLHELKRNESFVPFSAWMQRVFFPKLP